MTNKVSSYLIRSVIKVNNPICGELFPISGGVQLSMSLLVAFSGMIGEDIPRYQWSIHVSPGRGILRY